MTVTLTPELLADLREKAVTSAAQPRPDDMDAVFRREWAISRMEDVLTPAVVLALLDKIEALEKALSPVPIGRLLPEPLIIPARWACDTCGARQVYKGESQPPFHECKPASRLRRLHNLRHSRAWWVTPPKAEAFAAEWCAKKAFRMHPLRPRKNLYPA